ncbi:sensor histidine kinase [Alteromonas sp. ASW11-130]|uniref:sensor histidine kinase n=1 Tax=Alteromonas sp. ASW11-130 TaxID=3015775 RepID=UPI002242A156|nr:HAMP domain-containing sensor histidine kinase [Alteromonas sp. ASW11-130]MCW8092741.1 HAMP domain-containing histidine kinase [Alteromonas sp. ASW11-130]
MKTKECSAYLKANKEAIFSEWEKIANEKVHAASQTPDLVVRNYLPYFMDNLINTLHNYEGPQSEQEFVGMNFNAKYSHEHGRSRASVNRYDLRQVIHEYSLLRQVLRNRLLENNILCFTSLEIIDRFVEASSKEAGQHFMDSIQEVQDKLTGIIAHDLRNPISVSLSYIEVGELGLLPPESVYSALKRSLNRSLFLIQDLLDTAQVKAGSGMTFRFECTDIIKQVRTAVRDAGEIYENPISFNGRIKNAEGIYDHTAVQRAVENLISNAIKYGKVKGPITVGMRGNKERVVLSVHNEGSFVEKEQQELIFNYLARDADKANRQKVGWGLGLYLVKMVAKAHKGKAWVESDKEKGTTFFIELSRFSQDENTSFSQMMW